MLFLKPNSKPASAARELSGSTPMDSITISDRIGSSASIFVTIPLVLSSNPATDFPSSSWMPLLFMWACTKLAISASSWLSSCVCFSTNVTAIPRAARFSAISTPIKPPPTTTAVFGFCRLAASWIRKVSSTVRSVKTCGLSIPGSRGRIGLAPGERISLS